MIALGKPPSTKLSVAIGAVGTPSVPEGLNVSCMVKNTATPIKVKNAEDKKMI